MTSVAQRIAQYNREVGQPRAGLVSPELLTATQLDDGYGELDSTVENIRDVGPVVHYLSRLTGVLVASQAEAREAAESIFRTPFAGARRLSDAGLFPGARRDASESLQDFRLSTYADDVAVFRLDEAAARAACRLASYEMALYAGVARYNPADAERVPDAATVSHIITMTERIHDHFREQGPGTAIKFSFVSEQEEPDSEDEDGYSITLDHGDGDFITEQTVWGYSAQSSPPSKDDLLKLLVHYLMGEQSGLPELATQTHLGVFNPRLNTMYRLAIDDVPADVIEIVQRDIIGCKR